MKGCYDEIKLYHNIIISLISFYFTLLNTVNCGKRNQNFGNIQEEQRKTALKDLAKSNDQLLLF